MVEKRFAVYNRVRVSKEKSPTEQAFLEAFHEYSDALFRHAFFRLSDRDRALDVVQDGFMKAWDFIQKGGEVKNFKAFLYRVINNLIIDEYRKKRTDSLDFLLEEAPLAIEKEVAEGSVLEVELAMDEEALVKKVRDAIAELEPQYRSVVTMRFIDGLMPKEIAETLSITENVASVRIHRGVAKLKNTLKHHEA
jgi:RNA polymerase sigma-70 factor (ECF subfamily)